MHSIPSSVSVKEGINEKVRRKLDSVFKVNTGCLEVCAPPRQGAAAICGAREIAVDPFPAQLQDSFRVPCIFQSTVCGKRKLTLKESSSAMYLPQGNSSEALALDLVSDGEVSSRFLAFPLVKALQFSLAVTPRIGSSYGNKLKAEDNF